MSDLFRGQASRPYVRIVIQLLNINLLGATCPTLPNMLCAAQ